MAAAALLAVVLANSPWRDAYFAELNTSFPVRLGPLALELSAQEWVRKALMAVFFFVMGLEMKEELWRGELSSPRRMAAPVIAAIGGMAAPAAIYSLINMTPGGAPGGWPVPVATDVAFVLAALAIAAPRASALRAFLMALAVADDVGAVLLIAGLFGHSPEIRPLVAAGGVLSALMLLARWRRAPLALHVLGYLVVWGFTLMAGIDPALAGVACALTTPLRPRPSDGRSPISILHRRLGPYVEYVILPVFALTAAGFALKDASASPVSLGVAAGLIIGKPLGVLGAIALGSALRIARKPAGVSWREMAAGALLCGAGFSMSLYLADLALPGAAADARVGVLAGSLVSLTLGVIALKRRPAAVEEG